jgi:hypothetical protein
MNKICQHCNNQYEPINFRGSEQKFCSVNCRNEASKKRKIEEIKNELRNEFQNEQPKPTNNIHTQQYGNVINRVPNVTENTSTEFIKEMEKLRYENQIIRIENEHNLKLLELANKIDSMNKKFDEFYEEDNNEISTGQEDVTMKYISGILNTSFGVELAKNPAIEKLVTAFTTK